MITVAFPSALAPLARGVSVVTLDRGAETLRDVLTALNARHPGLVDRVLTEQGDVREHVNLFVGEENSRFLGGLAAPVRDGDTIEIVPAVSGG